MAQPRSWRAPERAPQMRHLESRLGRVAAVAPTRWLAGLLVLMAHSLALAQNTAQLPLLVGSGPSGTSYSVPVQTLLFFTALSFLPAVLLMMTGFTRIVIVLSLLRQALGTQSSPPNQVIVGLSLFLTFFVMGPTLDKVYTDAYLPYSKNAIAFEQALEKGEGPMRQFMSRACANMDRMSEAAVLDRFREDYRSAMG